MALKTDVPEDLEIWHGHPLGLRLREHPRLAEALQYRDAFPCFIRKGTNIDRSRLSRGDDPRLSLATLPVIRRSSVGPAVELRLEIDCPPLTGRAVDFGWLRLTDGESVIEESIVLHPAKRQVMTLTFPNFAEPRRFHAQLTVRDLGTVDQMFDLVPEREWTFYISFQTHLDLGWTDRVAAVRESLIEMTSGTAARVIEELRDAPDGERFVWTCECSEALAMAWAGSDAEGRDRLRAFIHAGLIRCCVPGFSYHSSIMTRDLMRRAIRRSFDLRREIDCEDSLDLSVAQQSDVPGHNWVLPDLFAAAGVPNAIIGHNHMVRGCALPPVFRWRGPDGGEVLTLASSCVDYGGGSPIPRDALSLFGLSANNPDAPDLPGLALSARVGYGENCGPTMAADEMARIRAWNAACLAPRLVVGGPEDYFRHLRERIDPADLPVVDREISDWWADGPASTPRAMTTYRKVMVQLPLVRDQIEPDVEAAVEENLLLHAEHTFGLNALVAKAETAENGWDTTGLANYVGSWEDKEAYAATAADALTATGVTVPDATLADIVPGAWDIAWDDAGIRRLTAPDGTVWVDRDATPDWPALGTVRQWLLPRNVGEWHHHNPPAAPNAGVRTMALTAVEPLIEGVRLRGFLDSPAGAVPDIVVDVTTAPTGLLALRVVLRDKEATAQGECLSLALPLAVADPAYVVDVGDRPQRIDLDQLPDANRDEHAMGLGWWVAADGKRLAVSSAAAWLWHFGGCRYCDWNRSNAPRTGEVYAHLFNNVWNTNFRCWLGGDLEYVTTFAVPKPAADPLAILHDLARMW